MTISPAVHPTWVPMSWTARYLITDRDPNRRARRIALRPARLPALRSSLRTSGSRLTGLAEIVSAASPAGGAPLSQPGGRCYTLSTIGPGRKSRETARRSSRKTPNHDACICFCGSYHHRAGGEPSDLAAQQELGLLPHRCKRDLIDSSGPVLYRPPPHALEGHTGSSNKLAGKRAFR